MKKLHREIKQGFPVQKRIAARFWNITAILYFLGMTMGAIKG
jgi:hypothetical protein